MPLCQYQRRLVQGMRTVFLQTAILGVLSLPCYADTVLYIDDISGQLGSVDINTGSVKVIGQLPILMSDIAFAPDGSLYGINLFDSDLWRVDPTTAAGTDVGFTGTNLLNALVFGKNGVLYAAGENNSDLYSINPSTGKASVLGNIGFESAGDLAFNQGNFYLSSDNNSLVRIDLSTFAGTAVGPIGYSNVYGMATGDDGYLYGVSGTTIFRIDPTTGAGTFVMDYSGHGLLSADGTSFRMEAVPEPSTWMLVLSSLLCMFGWHCTRQVRSASNHEPYRCPSSQ